MPDRESCLNVDNQSGFTLIELLIATAVGLLAFAAVSSILLKQRESFTRQNQLADMQSNGRAATDFISRSVMNSGYNIKLGRRILAASDHYLAVVYDEDNDGVIQNDEIFVYGVSAATGTATETFSVSPYFDQNDNGQVSNTETRTYSIGLILPGPPYNLYRYVLNKSDSGNARSAVAKYFDNLVLRYYDKNDDPLPATLSGGVRVAPQLPFDFSAVPSQLNDIRRVEVEVLARTKNPDPNPKFLGSGTYTANSVATYGGISTYSDKYRRQSFLANTSPRNLAQSPWGAISITASPNPIPCPSASTAVTATLLDSSGQVLGGQTVSFIASAGTLSSSSGTTNGTTGEVATTLTYDWSSPNKTITFSANAIISVDGVNRPVYNAVPVAFQTGSGTLNDNFDDGNATGWTEVGAVNWNVAAGQYKTSANGVGISVNGCDAWQDYQIQVKLGHTGLQTGDYIGMVLRYQNSNQYYMVRMYCTTCTGNPATHVHTLEIVNYNTGDIVLAGAVATFSSNTDYYLKASIQGSDIQAKVWEVSATEPDWMATATDPTYSSGEIGLTSNKNAVFFDDVAVSPSS